MGSEGSKSSKHEAFRILAKNAIRSDIYAFLLQKKSVNCLSTFCKNNMFGKNLVVELWSKNLKANQNTGFFKLEYLTNKLRYEVEFWM